MKIKFSIWDRTRKCIVNQEHILGVYFSRVNSEPYLVLYSKKKINPYRAVMEDDKVHCDDFEIMQSTGLFDENGKEIFEGDIVAFKYENSIYKSMVFFEDGMFKVEIKEYMIFSLAEVIESIELIGNIYENEDLLGD